MNRENEVIAVPRFCLVLLMGPSGSAKASVAEKWFSQVQVVSIERCMEMVADDPSTGLGVEEAYALLETWAAARLKLGRLTVVDSDCLEPRFRSRMIELARKYHAPAMLIGLDGPPRSGDRKRGRADTRRDNHGRETHRFQKAMARARDEGWNRVVRLRHAEAERTTLEIRPLRVDCEMRPPYDLIGDIHGCHDELCELLRKLGYEEDPDCVFTHPEGRHLVFVGDLVDRGPSSLKVLELAMRMHDSGTALVSPGNHDNKLLTYLTGGRVRVDHGLELTVAELEGLEPESRREKTQKIITWLRGLPPYLILDQGRLVVAHAGLPEHLQGRLSRVVAAWALYGEMRMHRLQNRASDRDAWPSNYRGEAKVVYGHTPSADVMVRGNTICIDQGCVFGGKLTCMRYPEQSFVHVEARRAYYADEAPDLEVVSADVARIGNGDEAGARGEPENGGSGAGDPSEVEAKVLEGETVSPKPRQAEPELAPLDHQADSVATRGPGGVHGAAPPSPGGASGGGKRFELEQTKEGALPDLVPLLNGVALPTRWLGPVQTRAHHVSRALDEISRSSVDPRWIVFLPPEVLPSASSPRQDYLEHPDEVFQYYRGTGLPLALEQMHPGRRGVVIVGRDEEICKKVFGIASVGVVYATTGRAFFEPTLQLRLVESIQAELERTGAFERLDARLLVFDTGLLPLNLLSPEVVARQCIPASSALMASRARAIEALDQALERGLAVKTLRDLALCEQQGARRMHELLERTVWTAEDVAAVKLAPFQLLATDKCPLIDRDRMWHFDEIDRWCESGGLFIPTRRMLIRNEQDEVRAVEMWEEMSAAGDAGALIRSLEWCPRVAGRAELPAVKVRSRDFLRLIHGPQYLAPNAMTRLKQRSLTARRTGSLKEWALATEGLLKFSGGARFADYHPYALAALAARLEAESWRPH